MQSLPNYPALLLGIDGDALGNVIAAFYMVSDCDDLTHSDVRKVSSVPEIRQSNSLSTDANFGLAGRLVGIARLARLRVAAECLGHVIDGGDDAIRIESCERRRKRGKNCKCHDHQQFGHRRALILARPKGRSRASRLSLEPTRGECILKTEKWAR